MKLIALLAFLTLSVSAAAQPAFDPTVDDPGAPIPGIAIAIAAAIGIAVVKLRRNK